MNIFDRIPLQEYEKVRDKIIEFLTTKGRGDYLVSLEYLNYHLKLDEKYPPGYLVHRMVDEGILEMAGFYDKTDNNKLRMTVGYRLKK